MAKRGSKRPGKGGSAARLPKSPRGTASRNAREPRRRSDGVESSEDEWTSNDEDAASQGVTSSVAASTSNAAVPLMPAPAQQPSMQHTQQDVNREWDRLAAELQAAPSAAAQQFEEQPQLHNGAPSAPWRRDVSQEMQQGTWWQEDDSDVYVASPAYVPQRATGAWQEAPQAASPRSQLHTEPTRWHRPDAQDMYVQVQEPDRSRSPIRRPSAQLSRVSMQPGQQQSARRDRRPSVVKEIVLPDSRRFVVQRVPVDSVYDPPAAPPQLPQEIDDDAELVRELSGVRTAQPASWSTPAQAHKQPVRRLQRPSSGSMMRLVRMKRVKSRQPPAQAQGSSGFAGPFSAVSQQPRATEYFY